MSRKRLDLDNSIPALIGVFGGIILLVGLFGTPNWKEWRHWGWGAIVGHFFGLAFVTMFVWALAFGITEFCLKDKHGDRIKRSRPAVYFLCVAFVILGSIGFVWINSGSVEPGDRMDYGGPTATEYRQPLASNERDARIWKMITVSILPALFGARLALGSKRLTND